MRAWLRAHWGRGAGGQHEDTTARGRRPRHGAGGAGGAATQPRWSALATRRSRWPRQQGARIRCAGIAPLTSSEHQWQPTTQPSGHYHHFLSHTKKNVSVKVTHPFQNGNKWKPYCSIFFYGFSPSLFLKFSNYVFIFRVFYFFKFEDRVDVFMGTQYVLALNRTGWYVSRS